MADSTNLSLGHLHAGGPLESPDQASYQIRVSSEPEDPAWDTFLAQTPGGHHVQTSLWAQVKALLGWRAARVVVRQGDCIVAGAQVLLRPLPLVGAIGHVSKGPLVAGNDLRLAKLVLDALHQVARAHHIRYLIIQPPRTNEALAQQLPGWGFRPDSLAGTEAQPPATVLLDLTQDLDDILAQMKKKTRYSIRHGLREGITVREGTERDLPTFYRLLVATTQRQHFSEPSEEYFSEMWRIFRPHGYIRLFLAEYAGEAVASVLAISFGDTVIYKKGAWSGHYSKRNPNDVLQWTAIRWAKAQGYRFYDFEGINRRAARALIQGEPLPDSVKQTYTSFKLGFGGQVVLAPHAYGYIYNPMLRWGYHTIFPKVANLSVVQNARNRLLARLRSH
jgi:peptidoglycan pentaglycine glycine transferase (the first glycine)